MKHAQIDYVSAIAVWLRDHEYFSKAKADREGGVLPTSITVFDQLDVLLPRVRPEDRERAVAALEWARDWKPAADDSDRDVEFRSKLAKIVEVGRVNRKTVGFLACLISSSDRDAQRELDRKAAELERAREITANLIAELRAERAARKTRAGVTPLGQCIAEQDWS